MAEDVTGRTAPAVDESTGLFQDVYSQLKVIASRQRYKAGVPHSLCTTEIVHEVYLRMDGGEGLKFQTSLQFFAYAARAMRHVLVDLARRRMNIKDGGDFARVPMTEAAVGAVAIDPAQALELDTALRALEDDSARAAQVVELHYFAGLPMERVAELLECSTRTVDRHWRYARSFLALQMNH